MKSTWLVHKEVRIQYADYTGFHGDLEGLRAEVEYASEQTVKEPLGSVLSLVNITDTLGTQEIVEYLLDPSTDPDACARDLNAVFADMGIHDVALMEGISQSVRSLLAKLDPNAQDMKVVAGLFSGGKARSRWNSYVEAFNALLAEDAALHAEIFGEEFASAYASVALGDEHGSKNDRG